MPLLKLLMSTENKLKRKHEHSHREKVESLCQKCKRKWITFSKRIQKKNTETTEQEQNIILSQKEIIFPEPFAFKGFLTNTTTEKPASVSHPESPTIKSMMQSLPSRSNQFILT